MSRFVCSTLLIATILAIVARDFPMVGHDLRYYMPRLLDTLIHLQANGAFAVQWYTPAFGGGLPAYPNPQHLQHTLLQAMTFFVNPWLAFLLTTAAASYVGFYAFAAFLERCLGLGTSAATLGAIFFIGNGFHIEHSIAGHVGFQLFPLAAVVLWALTDVEGSLFRNASLIALALAAMLYHAGVYAVILTAFSLLIALPVAEIVQPASVKLRRVAIIAVLALPPVAAMTASKVYAVIAFMRQFPREIEDTYNAGLLQALTGFAMQLVGAMSLAPLFALVGLDPALLPGGLSRLTGSTVRLGLWEVDVSLSPVAWVLLLVAGVHTIRRARSGTPPMMDRRVMAACVMAAVFSWLLIEATLARGFVYPWLKALPILRSLHVNTRIAAAFIMPLSMLAAVALHRYFGRHTRDRRANTALLGVALAAPLAYFLFPASVHERNFDARLSLETYDLIRAGEPLRVSRIVNAQDAEALAIGASSYLPYEPLFGYYLQDFATEVVPGDVRQVRDSAYNMTNPASLVFPELNGLRPFQRIAVGDEVNLERLLQRGLPEWQVPTLQRWLDRGAVAGLMTVLVGVALPRRR